MNVPFLDLQAQLKPIRPQMDRAIGEVLDRCNFVLGDQVSDFETQFAEYCGASRAVGVASGTDALELALRALAVPGDPRNEVIVPAHTYIATALAVIFAGFKPVLVDVNGADFLLDMEGVRSAIGSATRAVIPVHLYGRMMDLQELVGMAAQHGFDIVEDACQAHGAAQNGWKAGSIGRLGCFSFYPGKNLGCYGDGGAVVTSDSALAATLEALRNYGSTEKYHHPRIGFNSRLDSIQAAVLNVKLPHLDAWNRQRYMSAQEYNRRLEGVGDLVLPEIPASASHVFHLYVIRTQKRNELMRHLRERNIGTLIHYPTPLHLHGALRDLGYRAGDFPVAEQVASTVLSLPMYPEISGGQVEYVCDSIRAFFQDKGRG